MDKAADYVIGLVERRPRPCSAYGVYAQRYSSGGIAQGQSSGLTRIRRGIKSTPQLQWTRLAIL